MIPNPSAGNAHKTLNLAECWILPNSIPSGLHHSARGWPHRRTTLGRRIVIETNPERVKSRSDSIVIQPLQGCANFGLRVPKVAPDKPVQPWAEGFNPFGIDRWATRWAFQSRAAVWADSTPTEQPDRSVMGRSRHTWIGDAHTLPDRPTPTGLDHSARGWPRQRTTPGNRTGNTANPERVESNPA